MIVQRRPQLPALTGLRAVAAYSVLIAHCIAATYAGGPYAPGMATRLAYFGMSLFFVLSGFVVDYNYGEKLQNGGGLWQFFVARFARLYPLYAIVILLAIPNRLQVANTEVLAAYTTMTQSWVNMEEAFVAYTWSISTEWFFYVAFAVLVPFVALIRRPTNVFRIYLVVTVALFFCVFLGRQTLTDLFASRLDHGPASNLFWLWLTYYSPYVRIFEFGIGVFASRIYKSGEPKINLRSTALAAAWCIGILFAGGVLTNTITSNYLPNFVYAPALAVIVLYVCQANRIAQIFANPAFVFLGEISYSVYLLQSYGRTAAISLIGDTIFGLLLTLFFVTAIATLSFNLIEKPAKSAIKRVFWRALPAPEKSPALDV
jgi:peptidoglycan/LPS O-acetylase OafA/YrhL